MNEAVFGRYGGSMDQLPYDEIQTADHNSGYTRTMTLIVDAHQDLAYNILSFGRDYTRPVAQTRRIERDTETPARNGDTLLGWPEYQSGQVALIFATLFATPMRRKAGEWETQIYADAAGAHRVYRGQLDAYYRLVDDHPDKFRLVLAQADLQAVLDHWAQEDEVDHPVGLVVLMEGAEGVRDPSELEEWWGLGVRIIGPAWAGTRFCGGTREPGPLTKEGYALLDGMAEFGFVLDISHMDERAVLQALDHFPGTIVATHSNAAALHKDVDSNRNLSDRVIHGLVERDGVIGVVPANWFLDPHWKSRGGRDRISLHDVIDQVDYICQMAGDALHVGIGSDFDGGFGVQAVPGDVDSIADLQKVGALLLERGYASGDVQAIMSTNWIGVLRGNLPAGL